MRILNRTSPVKGLVALVGSAGLVLGSASGAMAAQLTGGAGAGTGYEYVPTASTDCGSFPLGIANGVAYNSDRFVLTHQVSTFNVADTGGPAVVSYVGPTTATIDIAPVVQAPQGARAGSCDGAPVVPGSVGITGVTIDGTASVPGPGMVHCDSVHSGGTYLRVTSAVVFTFVADCDITGNVVGGSVTNAPVQFVIQGSQVPCLVLCPPDVLNPDPTGDASSYMTTAFQAVGLR